MLEVAHNGRHLIGKSGQLQVGVKTQIIAVGHRHGEVAGTVPALGDAAGNHVKRHQLAGCHARTHALQVQIDGLLDAVAVLFLDNTGFDGLVGIHGDVNLGIADLVDAVGVVLALRAVYPGQ